MEWPRELIDESGRMLCELPGLGGCAIGPFDGALLCPFGRDDGASDTTDAVVEAALRRRLDCLVGCV